MDTYHQLADATARRVTQMYSTSFSLACRLFPPTRRQHIYNIYGLVRLADEIVDTYRGADQLAQLDALEAETYAALDAEYSTNVIVHAFARTARANGIAQDLIKPFFASMRQDITSTEYDATGLDDYIYGSAEVVGLMCLKVFAGGNQERYDHLKPGAQALGAAFQKVNFLRDLAADHDELGRIYFPNVDWTSFNDAAKSEIETDIHADFTKAKRAIDELPSSGRPAVLAAYRYYLELLRKIEATPAAQLKTSRLRLPNARKFMILGGTLVRERVLSSRRGK